MIRMTITKEELQNALRDLERLHERGLTASTAILQVYQAGDGICDTKAKYSGGLIMQGRPDDPSTNWGHISAGTIDWYRFDGKELIEE